MKTMLPEEETQWLSSFISEHKLRQIEQVLSERTRFITVVLEDIVLAQNASAVIRTADALGVQDIHIIENRHPYRVNPKVAMGSDHWITLHRYRSEPSNSMIAIQHLKEQGFKLVATRPVPSAYNPENLPLHQPVALCFGGEHHGLSDAFLNAADYELCIPMSGFAQSFNISVSAALVMYVLQMRLRSSAVSWRLSEDEKQQLRNTWYRKIRQNMAQAVDYQAKRANRKT